MHFHLAEGNLLEGVIFFIIMGVIWTISAITSALQKAKQKQRKLDQERIQHRIGQPDTHRPAPPQAPRPVMQRPVPPPPRASSAPTVKRRKRSTAQQPSKPPFASTGARAAAPPPPEPAAVETPLPSVHHGNRPTINAVTLNSTLRSQFILTEILQPPLALREERDI